MFEIAHRYCEYSCGVLLVDVFQLFMIVRSYRGIKKSHERWHDHRKSSNALWSFTGFCVQICTIGQPEFS